MSEKGGRCRRCKDICSPKGHLCHGCYLELEMVVDLSKFTTTCCICSIKTKLAPFCPTCRRLIGIRDKDVSEVAVS